MSGALNFLRRSRAVRGRSTLLADLATTRTYAI